MLYYAMLTQNQADSLNAFLVPAYCTPPTTIYVPVGLFPFVDGSQFALAINDSQFTSDQHAQIQVVLDAKKTYDEAIVAGWIQAPNDG